MGAATYYDAKNRETGEHELFKATSKTQVLQHLASREYDLKVATRDTMAELLPMGSPPVDLTKPPVATGNGSTPQPIEPVPHGQSISSLAQ